MNTATYNAISVFTNNWPIDKWSYLPIGSIISNGSDMSIVFKPTGDLVSNGGQKIIVREGSIVVSGTTTNWIGANNNVATIAVSKLLGHVTIKTP